MTMAMPKIIPINELKNTANISKTCKESQVPIVVTKNGYGDMVIMSLDLYEKTFAKMQAALLINESVTEIENGAAPTNGKTFFDNMKAKYGK